MGALVEHEGLPTPDEINAQFHRANLSKTLHLFKEIYNGKNYKFGDLTAKYNGWAPGSQEYENWMNAIAANYDPGAQDTIKGYVIDALTHRKDGAENPLQIIFSWGDVNGPKVVTSSFDPITNIYTITITGYPAP